MSYHVKTVHLKVSCHISETVSASSNQNINRKLQSAQYASKRIPSTVLQVKVGPNISQITSYIMTFFQATWQSINPRLHATSVVNWFQECETMWSRCTRRTVRWAFGVTSAEKDLPPTRSWETTIWMFISSSDRTLAGRYFWFFKRSVDLFGTSWFPFSYVLETIFQYTVKKTQLGKIWIEVITLRYGCEQSYNDRSNRAQHERRAHGIVGKIKRAREAAKVSLWSSSQIFLAIKSKSWTRRGLPKIF